MKHSLILENIPIPLIVFDLQSKLLMNVTASFSELIGIPSNEIIGKPCSYLDSFITTNDDTSIFSRIYDLNVSPNEIANIRTALEVKKFYCKTRSIIEDSFVYGICAFEEARNNIDENQDNAGLKNIANRSHELRSALTTILGITQFLEDNEFANPIKEFDDSILTAVQTVLRILDLGSTAQDIIAENKRVIPNLVDLIRDAVREYEHAIKAKNISLKFVSYKKIVECPIDTRVFYDVVIILLNNAIRSTEKSEVSITLYEKADEKGNIIALKIADAGVGIKKIYLDLLSGASRAVSKSEMSDEDQVYVDLLRCKRLVEETGGTLIIDSQYGTGTNVTAQFYLKKVTALPETPISNDEAGISEKISFFPEVLLVDDDQIVYRIVSKYLVERCNMDYARDGRRALSAVVKKHYDIILLDINLGIGLTGLQVAKRMRQMPEYKNTPIVAITAYAMMGDKERALKSGCTFYQSKPFTRADMITVFNQCLQRIT